MIDFTTVQLNPIPPSVVNLQNQNMALQKENTSFRAILIFGGVILGLFITIEVIKKLEETKKIDEKKRMNTRKK